MFLLERREVSGTHSRAFQDKPVAVHPDGTLLPSNAGTFNLAQDEWFLLKQVVEVFAAFASGEPCLPFVRWRKMMVNYAVEADQSTRTR